MQPDPIYLRTLGGGLILRRANAADAEALSAFNGFIHGDNPDDARMVSTWTRDLLTLPHPTFNPDDFTIVEDTANGKIVSSLNLISQTWAYAGIPFKVGRPELVGTDPAYRGRGLVRAQFEVIHEWSRQRGEMLQAITGIPYFYRQFGYEMGLEVGGGRSGFTPQVPVLKEGENEPFRIRPALEADLPFILKVYRHNCRSYLVTTEMTEALLGYELQKSAENVNRVDLRVIESEQGVRVGYLALPVMLNGTLQAATQYDLAEGVSSWAVTPSVIRFLFALGKERAAALKRSCDGFAFNLGSQHPVYQAAAARLPLSRPPYAFFVRVPDLPGFVRLIAPVLEGRLACSVMVGFSGEQKLSFYRSGLRLVFESGKLTTVEAWQPSPTDRGDGAFPDLTFLQLFFGRTSLIELRRMFSDCWVNEAAGLLLEILFPPLASSVWPIS